MSLSTASNRYEHFVGIDVAAVSATACEWQPTGASSAPFTFAQSQAGYATLHQRLRQQECTPTRVLIVLEATGSYWMNLASYLVRQGYAVSVINPAQAHYFAKALLQRSKSDELDAQMLAELAFRLQPDCWSPPPAVYEELQQRLTQRDSLVAMRQQVRNQLHALQQHPVVVEAVQQRMQALLTTLESQIKQIEQELRVVLQQDAAWARAAQRLQSITGVGLITTGWLLVATLAFTACETPQAATAYAGLAPRLNQSGTSLRGRATIGHGGHARLRSALYLATLSATRFNPVIHAFYERLRAAGKPNKVARCAAARKLLHIAWAVVTKDQDFDPTYGQAAPDHGLAA
mgnify:CR=1 FL=1